MECANNANMSHANQFTEKNYLSALILIMIGGEIKIVSLSGHNLDSHPNSAVGCTTLDSFLLSGTLFSDL